MTHLVNHDCSDSVLSNLSKLQITAFTSPDG